MDGTENIIKYVRKFVTLTDEEAAEFGSSFKEVTTRLENRPSGVLVYIEDTGIGISKADQEHIFERYRQFSGEGRGT